VAVFTLEMPEHQLVQRILASEAQVDAQKLRTGEFSRQDWQRIDEQASRLYQTRLYLDGSATLSASQIASKSRRLKHRLGKLGLIVIDYLQLMEAPRMGRESSRARMSRPCRARSSSSPRSCRYRSSPWPSSRRDVEKKARKPILSDLRESGAIEQDADLVLFIHREESDGPEEKAHRADHRQAALRTSGTVEVLFQKEFSRFVNLGHE